MYPTQRPQSADVQSVIQTEIAPEFADDFWHLLDLMALIRHLLAGHAHWLGANIEPRQGPRNTVAPGTVVTDKQIARTAAREGNRR